MLVCAGVAVLPCDWKLRQTLASDLAAICTDEHERSTMRDSRRLPDRPFRGTGAQQESDLRQDQEHASTLALADRGWVRADGAGLRGNLGFDGRGGAETASVRRTTGAVPPLHLKASRRPRLAGRSRRETKSPRSRRDNASCSLHDAGGRARESCRPSRAGCRGPFPFQGGLRHPGGPRRQQPQRSSELFLASLIATRQASEPSGRGDYG